MFHYVKYIGETVLTKSEFYDRFSKTILTKGKTYRLLKPFEIDDTRPWLFIHIEIEDDVLLSMNSFDPMEIDSLKRVWGEFHSNYKGTFGVLQQDDIRFEYITLRDYNLKLLIK